MAKIIVTNRSRAQQVKVNFRQFLTVRHIECLVLPDTSLKDPQNNLYAPLRGTKNQVSFWSVYINILTSLQWIANSLFVAIEQH